MFKKSKSFGLIETVVAVGILSIVVGSISTLGVTTIHGTVIAKHKTEAYFIAQDAMEQVKGKRDWVWENWSEASGITWQNFWTDIPGGSQSDPRDFNDLRDRLNNQCVFISHVTGAIDEVSCSSPISNTLKFTRMVSEPGEVAISGVPDGISKKVTISVVWEDYGVERSVSVISYLTDWQPRY